MFPKHCSEVSLIRVSFPLTKENIVEKSVGRVVYHNTNYVILANGAELAVAKVHKSRNPGRFKRVESAEVISLPEETGFVKNPSANVNNLSLMASIAEKEGKETIVVHGEFEHISFISKEKLTPLLVLDFVPPNPPKLLGLVERALDAGRIGKPLKIFPNILDLNKLAEASDKSFVIFPCHTEVSAPGKKILFLVGTPDISSIGVDNVTLIGCDLSQRIFNSVYGKMPSFINMCPLNRAEAISQKEVKCITRCCKTVEGHLRVGNTAIVSYDPTLHDVEEAVMDLFELSDRKEASYKVLPIVRSMSDLVGILLRHISRT